SSFLSHPSLRLQKNDPSLPLLLMWFQNSMIFPCGDALINSNQRIITYFDKNIKERQYDGETWKVIADEIINHLPQNVFISFDIDGLDPKLCPHTGTPVQGGFETEQIFYLFKKVIQSGRKLVGFDLVEVGVSHSEYDENVGARCLFKLCNMMVAANS
ncbi:arginase family protein, partial [Ferruginibacter sp.]